MTKQAVRSKLFLNFKNYQLFFFVLEYKYNQSQNNQSQKVSKEEIDKLRPYSNVIEIFTEKNSPDNSRAEEFRKFIEKHLST
ncbi:hypothetical protein [Nostoc sp. WHI]|uniref:hypothetical protein n=1 Tax=Nostoc sp. WHI TaxID=2650611 RepID=UPI0018C7F4EE|nr:hypothetical protein [Nostoc sp. WHI]MBG1265385.1 hypothetical protein [Nostoc sp. WHI]